MFPFNPKAINRQLIACFDIDESKLPARYRRGKRGSTRNLLSVYMEAKRHVREAQICVKQEARRLRVEMLATRFATGQPLFNE